MDPIALIIPSFIAGLFTFLAPCTLPLVPGYLAFIAGTSFAEATALDRAPRVRRRIFVNGLFYVIGFSVVFIALGTLFGLGGAALVRHRIWLSRVGGIVIALFGLFMLGIITPKALFRERQLRAARVVRPGNPWSSLLFGATFAFGWTPCVGPVLGSVLFLASASATVASGAVLLAVFSLGLAVPFLAIAVGIGSAARLITRYAAALGVLSRIGGVFLIGIGILLVADRFGAWLGYAYRLFDFFGYDRLLDLL